MDQSHVSQNIRRGTLRLLSCAFVALFASTVSAADPHQGTENHLTQVCAELIAAEDVQQHIELLAGEKFLGREGKQAEAAAKYIAEFFQAQGLKPLFGDKWFQPLPGSHLDNESVSIGQNVGGWIPGSDPELKDEIIIVSAHYDHLGVRQGKMYPGADDNASGVSMMLETARQLAQARVKPRRSIAFVGFDLEERLLWGSRWFAEHPPWELSKVKLFITADMIGRSLGNLPLPTVFVVGSEQAPGLKKVLDSITPPAGLEVAQLGVDLIGTRSDYGPFRDHKVPFLFFSTGEHPDYHTPQDTADRIDFAKTGRVSNLVLAVTQQVANSATPPEWAPETKPDLEEAKSVHRITTLLLEGDSSGKLKLTGVQRFFVSQVQSKTGFLVKRGSMTVEERVWLVRAAQMLLATVF